MLLSGCCAKRKEMTLFCFLFGVVQWVRNDENDMHGSLKKKKKKDNNECIIMKYCHPLFSYIFRRDFQGTNQHWEEATWRTRTFQASQPPTPHSQSRSPMTVTRTRALQLSGTFSPSVVFLADRMVRSRFCMISRPLSRSLALLFVQTSRTSPTMSNVLLT